MLLEVIILQYVLHHNLWKTTNLLMNNWLLFVSEAENCSVHRKWHSAQMSWNCFSVHIFNSGSCRFNQPSTNCSTRCVNYHTNRTNTKQGIAMMRVKSQTSKHVDFKEYHKNKQLLFCM